MCYLQLPVFTLQRDSKYFERPMEFIPERWVEGCPEEQSLNRHVPGSWMAFGEGTRVCVGQRFALVEAKITLAKLFQEVSTLTSLAGYASLLSQAGLRGWEPQVL